MNNTSKITYPIKANASLNDDAVVAQLPINIIDQLGPLEESGFHLMLNRRDLFYKHGLIQYTLGERKAHVELD
ncbi:hypothetical protein SynSYN20_00842 [Synechococcus sp. SYN20]|nr:hypothetical protein SynSYN20_00842 [Synechococcus sp. SYN20]